MGVKIAFLNGELDERALYRDNLGAFHYALANENIGVVNSNTYGYSQIDDTAALASNSEGTKVLKKIMDYRLTYTGYPLVWNPGYTDASWISNTKDNLFPRCWVFCLALVAQLTATLAKAYSQMYNGKSRHLGVSHSMIHELITNGVVSIEFVRSQQNLVDHLTKGLARDLVLKSAKGIGLKSY
ncbi:hypothetical protein Tco_1145063 [Tanacetum coccineum]